MAIGIGDPVENAVYVPWLVLIASIHVMMTYKNSGTALKASIILSITVFILILYSTFLTRSGILGDASVHSFTDLGLSGQLLLYLLFFTVAAVILCSNSLETNSFHRKRNFDLLARVLGFSWRNNLVLNGISGVNAYINSGL